ncbi:MAG: S-layer homology domain-containing protein [Myxococcota bacterium]
MIAIAFGLRPSSRNHFHDDDGEWYEQYANALKDAGVTTGCGGGRFCGNERLTRGMMITFIGRAGDIGESGSNRFDDDNGRYYEGFANRAHERGITRGCSARMFCGEQQVTRAEAIAFVVRTLRW